MISYHSKLWFNVLLKILIYLNNKLRLVLKKHQNCIKEYMILKHNVLQQMRQNWIIYRKIPSRLKFNPFISYFSWFILSFSEIIYLCYYSENIYYKFHVTFYLSLFNDIIAEIYYERVTLYLWFNNLYFNELPNLFSLTYCLINSLILYISENIHIRYLIHLVDVILYHRIYIFDSRHFYTKSIV